MYDQLLNTGVILLKNLYNPENLIEDVPTQRGQISYGDGGIITDVMEEEAQVIGSFSRYSYPKYRQAHNDIRLTLQKVLGKELYNTYYFDRFYFKNQKLDKHTDRDACEISVSLNISSNTKEPWAFQAKLLDGTETQIVSEPGWGIVYMGCDVLHWRSPLRSRHSLGRRVLNRLTFTRDDTYHHQVFFHYVLANGHRAHCYYDRCR